MNVLVDIVLIVVLLTSQAMLASSRLNVLIRMAAIQGLTLGVLPLAALFAGGEWTVAESSRVVLFALATMGLKGVLFPVLLQRGMREADVRHEVEPYVGYALSMLIGIAALAAMAWVSGRLPLPGAAGEAGTASPFVVPMSLYLTLVGLFLIVARKKALTQVIGYIVLENGVYLFGVSMALEVPFLVELGVFLDVFVAVFIMGIMLFHINREFDHIDADRLSALKE